MFLKGFRFGMILQLAIGPVCMFVLQTALAQGFFSAFGAVLGTAVTDGSEILLAIWGVGAAMKAGKGARRFFKWFGAGVIFLFGLNSILGAFGLSVLPSLALAGGSGSFAKAVLLALSNPLTVLFWAGVFAGKIARDKMAGRELYLFGAGCVGATLFFLTLVAAAGHFTRRMLPAPVIAGLNIAVGLVLIGFGVRNLLKKDEE